MWSVLNTFSYLRVLSPCVGACVLLLSTCRWCVINQACVITTGVHFIFNLAHKCINYRTFSSPISHFMIYRLTCVNILHDEDLKFSVTAGFCSYNQSDALLNCKEAFFSEESDLRKLSRYRLGPCCLFVFSKGVFSKTNNSGYWLPCIL